MATTRSMIVYAWIIAASLQNSLIAQSNGYLGMSLPADFRPFSDDSPWNTPIPENPAIDPNSPAMIATMEAVLDALGTPRTIGAAVTQWTLPIHVIDSTVVPRVDVPSTNFALYWTVDPDQDAIAQNIPMPTEAWQDPQTDGHMALVDPNRMLAWEFSRAVPLGNGQWQASGVDIWDLKGPGWKMAFVDPSWWGVGNVASGLPFLAGVVRVEEVQAGEIRHALIVSCPSNRAKTLATGEDEELCRPAANTDGWGIGANYIPEGARLQLDPELDLDGLGLSEDAKVVARAMQTYGMYVGLNGPNYAIYFQNLGPTGGAWATVPDVFDIINLPTSALRVLQTETVSKDPGGGIERSVEFVTTPSSIVAGAAIDPITVRLVNAAGQPVFTGREFDVMLNIGMWEGTNPGQGELTGTIVRTTTNGIAVFDDLVIDQPGTGYRFFAMPQDLIVAVSQPMTVLARGDIDGDGDVDAIDQMLFINTLTGIDTTPSHVDRSDLDGDGQANGNDIEQFVQARLVP